VVASSEAGEVLRKLREEIKESGRPLAVIVPFQRGFRDSMVEVPRFVTDEKNRPVKVLAKIDSDRLGLRFRTILAQKSGEEEASLLKVMLELVKEPSDVCKLAADELLLELSTFGQLDALPGWTLRLVMNMTLRTMVGLIYGYLRGILNLTIRGSLLNPLNNSSGFPYWHPDEAVYPSVLDKPTPGSCQGPSRCTGSLSIHINMFYPV